MHKWLADRLIANRFDNYHIEGREKFYINCFKGVQPIWLKNGKQIITTLLHVQAYICT